MLPKGTRYADIASIYKGSVNPTRAYTRFMSVLSDVYEEFVHDLDESEKIGDDTRNEFKSGLGDLSAIVYPKLDASVAPLSPAQRSLLQVVASTLEKEDSVSEKDLSDLRESIQRLFELVESKSLPENVKQALLEVIRLSRNALDEYTIYGVGGFNDAFKRMLAELSIVSLRADKDELKKSEWWTKAVDHLRLFDAIIARISKYTPLLEKATEAIILGS